MYNISTICLVVALIMPDGIMEINTVAEARDAWELFFGRFFSPEIPPGVDVTFDPEVRQFLPRDKKMDVSRENNPRYSFPEYIDIDQFSIADNKTRHSDDFDDFLNGHPVILPQYIDLNETGLQNVEEAIKKGNYRNYVLKDKDHIYYALWLFKQNKITRQQMTTILYIDQIRNNYSSSLKAFQIFKQNTDFSKTIGLDDLTPEAKNLWLPNVINNWYGGDYNQQQLEQFLRLIATAPKSEQSFFITPKHHDTVTGLGDRLRINKILHRTLYNEDLHDLYFSFGMIEALQIVKKGINGAAASRAQLGKVGIDEVKKGVESNYRPTAISMADQEQIPENTHGIHDHAFTATPIVTLHDVFHSRLHNTIPPQFHTMLDHMSEMISKHTKHKWSKTIWELVDREFGAFKYKTIDLISPEQGAKHFIEMLHYRDEDKTFLFKDYNTSKPELSDSGFAVVWDMVNNSEVWKKLYKVDIDSLDKPYEPLIKQVRSFKETVDDINSSNEPEPTEILTLKYRFFCVCNQNDFQKICTLIDSLHEKLILNKDQKATNEDQKLVFGKYSIDINNKNLSILKFKNMGTDILVDESSVKRLIPILVNIQLASLLGEKNEAAVITELDKIKPELKSSHAESRFSKAMLDGSVSTFSSTTAKLDFLEKCYESITRSQNYTRRHAVADKLFSFFKNPLTTSQRLHIALLKEKMNEVVNDYQNENRLSDADSAQFQWYLKNRGSKLAVCNIDRFSLAASNYSNPIP